MNEQPVAVIECSRPWIRHIFDRKKTVEGKKGTGRWRSIAEGDIVRFRDNSPAGTPGKPVPDFEARVHKVVPYGFKPDEDPEMNPWAPLHNFLEGEGLAVTLPGVLYFRDAMAVYQGLWWADEAVVREHGILAFRIGVLH